VTNNEFHAIGNELVGNRNTLLWIGSIVTKNDFDLFTIDATGSIDVSSSLFSALLKLGTESSVRASQWTGNTNLDICPCGAAEGDHRCQRNG
jgi:hypothetical protein